MRAIAALMVMAFHVTHGKWHIGAAGVDIFFVISGFIMGAIGMHERPGTFLVKRAIRIIPLYWTLTLIMCAASLVPGLFSTFSFDAVRLIKSLVFIPYTDPAGHLWPLMVVGWTLNYEIFFYLVFAAGLWFKRPLLITCVVMLAFSLLAPVFGAQSDLGRFYFNPILLEFMAGLILSRYLYAVPAWLGFPALLAGIIGLALSQIYGPADPGLWRTVLCGIPAFLIVGGACIIEKKIGWSKLSRPLEYIGDASFSLYMLHPILNDLCQKVLGSSVKVEIMIPVIAVIAAFASYFLFEKPSAKWLKNWLLKSRANRPERPLAEKAQAAGE